MLTKKLVNSVKNLKFQFFNSNFAKSQPQAAYAAFCFGEQKKYSHFLRTIAGMRELLKPVDKIIQNDLAPRLLEILLPKMIYYRSIRYQQDQEV